MSKFALVSTVDSLETAFPHHCVIVFETERDALLHAAKLIVANDPLVSYSESECRWDYEDDHYSEPEDLLEAWQYSLSPTEYFHVLPVVPS